MDNDNVNGTSVKLQCLKVLHKYVFREVTNFMSQESPAQLYSKSRRIIVFICDDTDQKHHH